MIIQILGDWDYKPTACNNVDMVISFRRLSGNDELALRRGDEGSLPVRRFLATISAIRNPVTLEFPDGSRRDMKAEDIPEVPELADLYYELVVAYADKTQLTEIALKKKDRIPPSGKRTRKPAYQAGS